MKTHTNAEIDLLRFITSGSVDDGKSTLIGRLMFDTKSIFEDQLQAIQKSSAKRGDAYVNLALLTDGLKAEREQGITIDVAYRYFSTPKRKFIMADTPGHVQYTRNMVTGASTAHLSIILIDARHGVIEQTRRHAYIASLLGIKHVIVCVNKMDLVDFQEDVFEHIKKDFLGFFKTQDIPDVHIVPISALQGDNVVDSSKRMTWYKGKTVLEILETVELVQDVHLSDGRFPVQRVIRPQSEEYPDFRGYAGRIEGGVFQPGDDVTILPSGIHTKIEKIYNHTKELEKAFYPMSVTMTLKDTVDVSRGDMLVRGSLPSVEKNTTLMISWFNDRKLQPKGTYMLKHTTREVKVSIVDVLYKVNIHTLEPNVDDLSIEKNDIAKITIKASQPLYSDAYAVNKGTGSIILIDEFTHETVAVGMIV